jgi:hypothetical protein
LERRFFIAWLPAPDARLLQAIARATGVDAVRLLPTWYGCDKQTNDLPDPKPEDGPGSVEFERCGVRTMQLQGVGPAVSMATAALARAIALADGRPLLFSDCHLFPFTYLMARADGAIVHVVVRSADEVADDFELLPDDPAAPDYWRRDILFAPGDALPPPRVAQADPPEHCAVFGGPCPKRQERCVPILRG